MADVFISYTRPDLPQAEKVKDLLADEGWDVWFDAEIYAGAVWEQLLLETLASAKAVVVLWTERSIRSRWVKREAALAADAKKLVPVVLEACELPRRFAGIEAAQLIGWTGGPHPELEVLFAGLGTKGSPSRIDTVRPGFDPGALGPDVGLPAITGVGEELRYLHFSVVMNPARRLAWYVAYNMAPLEGDRPPRGNRWMPDPVLPRMFQPLDNYYRGSGRDRGHLARPSAVTWGEYRFADIANRQSFFYTNTCPQQPVTNRYLWRALEEWESRVTYERGRAIGFSGPILRADDPLHRDVTQRMGRLVARQSFRLPRSFWKVVVARGARGRLSLAAFWLDEIEELALARPNPEAYRRVDTDLYRTSLEAIEAETGLGFSETLHRAAKRPLELTAEPDGAP